MGAVCLTRPPRATGKFAESANCSGQALESLPMPNPLPLLDRWDNFYVIVGSSAAGLTGLTFVVIALASDAKVVRLSGLRTFITPIVSHFGTALWISALLCIPG